MPKYKPTVVCSLHGFKSHGKWQGKLSNFMSTEKIPAWSFDYGYQFFACLIPGFRRRLIKKFYSQYCQLIENRNYKIDIGNPMRRPSIVVHSLGSYILCNAMLKYKDIRFDKIILCGSIVAKKFDWDLLFKRNQIHYVKNEYSKRDKVVRWGWILTWNKGGFSGWRGFKYSGISFDQQKFDYFDHGAFFEGAHMKESWLPFLLKEPPEFKIVTGGDLRGSVIEDFTPLLDQTTIIDEKCYGKVEHINDGLAEKWVETNRDIYSFLINGAKVSRPFHVIGYVNAMLLKDDIFDKLLAGNLQDPDVSESDILPYEYNINSVNLYIMSIAIDPDYQKQHLGLKDVGAEKLLNSLFDKLEHYYRTHNLKVKKIAAVGFSEIGIKFCKFFGLKDTGIARKIPNHRIRKDSNILKESPSPIYLLDLENPSSVKASHGSIRNLVNLYNSSM